MKQFVKNRLFPLFIIFLFILFSFIFKTSDYHGRDIFLEDYEENDKLKRAGLKSNFLNN